MALCGSVSPSMGCSRNLLIVITLIALALVLQTREEIHTREKIPYKRKDTIQEKRYHTREKIPYKKKDIIQE